MNQDDEKRMDVWLYVANMACEFSPTAGATMDAVCPWDGQDEGDSLVGAELKRRAADDAVVRLVRHEVVAAESLPPHTLSVGEIVYCGMEEFPCYVKRVGYGSYLNDVRVLRLGETDSWRWDILSGKRI